jgi:hypothetical protein
MTLWQDPPPQTRRQARENERTAAQKAAGQGSRRAGTSEPTPAGEIPTVNTPFGAASRLDDDRPAIPASAFAEPGVTPPSRPIIPTYSGTGPALPPVVESAEADVERAEAGIGQDEGAGLYRQAPDLSRDEPVTQPMNLVAARAAAGTSASGSAPQERTLTRRELRAMLQAQEANQQAGHPDQVVPVTFTSGDEPEGGAAAQESTPVTSSTPSAWPFAPFAPSSAAPAPAAAPADAPAPQQEKAPAPVDAEAGLERQPFTPPTGHWSTAAELDDKNQFDQIISRNVGQSGSATTTNALILPSLPNQDATGPLTSTGEILVTGSIDLPRGLGSTGAHPDRIDSSDLDRLLDGDENEFNTSEVAPIRASRAISTHTSTRGVITPPKKRGGRLPLVLMITAGVLAVGVIGLLVAAYVLNVF